MDATYAMLEMSFTGRKALKWERLEGGSLFKSLAKSNRIESLPFVKASSCVARPIPLPVISQFPPAITAL